MLMDNHYGFMYIYIKYKKCMKIISDVCKIVSRFSFPFSPLLVFAIILFTAIIHGIHRLKRIVVSAFLRYADWH